MSTSAFARARQELTDTGTTVLQSAPSSGEAGWYLRHRRATIILLSIGVFGVLAIIVGVLLRDVDGSILLFLFGGFLAFMGLISAPLMILVRVTRTKRDMGPSEPVTLDAHGVRLRGFGPIPWADLLPPSRERILTRHDVGGILLVMPLTPNGIAGVASMPGQLQLAVGPIPYLGFQVRHLLLPGLQGLSEAQTEELFRFAHERFTRPAAPPPAPDRLPTAPHL